MKINLYVSVKFRALGITFGSFQQEWEIPVKLVAADGSAQVVGPAQKKVVLDVDQRGVRVIMAVS